MSSTFTPAALAFTVLLLPACGGSPPNGLGGAGSQDPIDLLTDPWVVVNATDVAGNDWSGSRLLFERQEPDGTGWTLEGHFEWSTTNSTLHGTELFRGTLDSSRLLHLQGTQLVGAVGLALGTYVARVSAGGQHIADGSWSGVNVVPGSWEAERDPPQALTLRPTGAARWLVVGIDPAGTEAGRAVLTVRATGATLEQTYTASPACTRGER